MLHKMNQKLNRNHDKRNKRNQEMFLETPENKDGQSKMTNRYISKKESLLILLPVMLFVIMIITIVMIQRQLSQIGNQNISKINQYQYHYVLITEDDDPMFWESVYEGAQEEAILQNAYVERLGINLVNELSKKELLEIAINANVDGIIVGGDNTEEIKELIDKAVEENISVITVRNDCAASKRQTYVGISSYNLGHRYGSEIVRLINENKISTDKKIKINILMDSIAGDQGQDIVITGIRERIIGQLGSTVHFEIEGVLIDNSTTFSAEESIRDLFVVQEDMPDIIVCLSSGYTQCAYQAAVDYNKVGEVNILGYYDTNAILEAVAKEILYSTISIDAKEMGHLSIKALAEIRDNNYFSNYLAVNAEIIKQEDAKEILRQREADEK